MAWSTEYRVYGNFHGHYFTYFDKDSAVAKVRWLEAQGYSAWIELNSEETSKELEQCEVCAYEETSKELEQCEVCAYEETSKELEQCEVCAYIATITLYLENCMKKV